MILKMTFCFFASAFFKAQLMQSFDEKTQQQNPVSHLFQHKRNKISIANIHKIPTKIITCWHTMFGGEKAFECSPPNSWTNSDRHLRERSAMSMSSLTSCSKSTSDIWLSRKSPTKEQLQYLPIVLSPTLIKFRLLIGWK